MKTPWRAVAVAAVAIALGLGLQVAPVAAEETGNNLSAVVVPSVTLTVVGTGKAGGGRR